MNMLKCENCGKEFTSKKKEARFCSRSCYQDFCKRTGCLKGTNIKNKIKVICVECGKVEFVNPSRAKKYLCCSTTCLGKYNSKRYNTRLEKVCPICGKSFYVKQSHFDKRTTCGNRNCLSKWKSLTWCGEKNPNYKTIEKLLISQGINERNSHDKSKRIYQHVVKTTLGLNSLKSLPKGYVIHHKDSNHENNDPKNLVVLNKTAHRLIHTWFGNILIKALHTNLLDREIFFSICNDEQKQFYEQIIDLDITRQVVVKEGELLENPEEDNQQPNIYRNIIVGSETNNRVLAGNAEDSNVDTSALPIINGEDIVRTACITNEDADLEDKELLG